MSLVYFIQGAPGYIKIGFTTDLKKRLESLQTGSPEKLKVLGVMPGDRSLEAAFHELFSETRRSGEWFLDSPELRAQITESCISEDEYWRQEELRQLAEELAHEKDMRKLERQKLTELLIKERQHQVAVLSHLARSLYFRGDESERKQHKTPQEASDHYEKTFWDLFKISATELTDLFFCDFASNRFPYSFIVRNLDDGKPPLSDSDALRVVKKIEEKVEATLMKINLKK